MNRRRLALLSALLVVLAAGGAYAAIPDGTGVFHACAKKTYQDDGTPRGKGELRLIDHDAGEECNLAQETHIHFNEKGQRGDQGPQGPQGPAGPAGPGSSTFTATMNRGPADALLGTLPNGLEIWGSCTSDLNNQPLTGVFVRAPYGADPADGLFGFGTAVATVPTPEGPREQISEVHSFGLDSLEAVSYEHAQLSVVAARVFGPVDARVRSPFVRIDIVAELPTSSPAGVVCNYTGMITP